jgi:hypothetical protein
MRCPACGAVVHYRTASEAATNLIGTLLAIMALALLGSAILGMLVAIWRYLL